MALWKDPLAKESNAPSNPIEPVAREPEKNAGIAPIRDIPQPAKERSVGGAAPKESFIAPDLSIEGKIEGAGHVRIAGRFKGDVQVQGNVTIEQGSHVTGEVKADTVIIGGNLDGNVDAGSRVELLSTGILNGDLKAGSLTVAAGSRMRGRAEFGWDTKSGAK